MLTVLGNNFGLSGNITVNGVLCPVIVFAVAVCSELACSKYLDPGHIHQRNAFPQKGLALDNS